MNKIIFISNSLADINKVKGFAKKSGYSIAYYSKEEWNKKSKKSHSLSQNKKNTDIEKSNSATNILPLPIPFPPSQTMDEIKVEAIKKSLLRARGNVSKAAKILSIGRATLYRKIKNLKLNPESFRKQFNEEEVKLTFKKTA